MSETTHYEIMVIVKPDLSEKETNKNIDTVKAYIADLGGSISYEDIWGKRDTAYPMKGYEQAFYGVLYFEMPNENIATLKKELGLEQSILRILISKLPKHLDDIKKHVEEGKKLEEQLQKEYEEKKGITAEKKEEKKTEKKTTPKPKKTEEKAEEPKKKAIDELDDMLKDLDTM